MNTFRQAQLEAEERRNISDDFQSFKKLVVPFAMIIVLLGSFLYTAFCM